MTLPPVTYVWLEVERKGAERPAAENLVQEILGLLSKDDLRLERGHGACGL